jgi:hypothetical protein
MTRQLVYASTSITGRNLDCVVTAAPRCTQRPQLWRVYMTLQGTSARGAESISSNVNFKLPYGSGTKEIHIN